MYSKIKVAGHPVHPMLAVFPVACCTGTPPEPHGMVKGNSGKNDTRGHGHATVAERTRRSCGRANRTAHQHE